MVHVASTFQTPRFGSRHRTSLILVLANYGVMNPATEMGYFQYKEVSSTFKFREGIKMGIWDSKGISNRPTARVGPEGDSITDIMELITLLV